MPKNFYQLSVLFILLAGFVVATHMIAQNDTFWHLAIGRKVLDNYAIQKTDPFSWTVPQYFKDVPWNNHEWLSQLLFALIHKIGGWPLLTITMSLVATLCLWLSLKISRGGNAFRLLGLAFITPMVASSWSIRPHIFTHALILLTLLSMKSGRLYFLPFLFLLWANLHGGVLFGFIILVCAVFVSLFFERKKLPGILIYSALSAIAALVNPLGIKVYGFQLSVDRESRELGILEWLAPGVHTLTDILFWLGALLFLFLLVANFKRIKVFSDSLTILVCFLIGIGAAMGSRQLPIFALLWLPAVSYLLPAGAKVYFESPVNKIVAPIGILLSLILVQQILSSEEKHLEWNPISGEVINSLSKCPDNFFNTYNDGGFLIYNAPDKKVFVDSRQLPYPHSFLLEHKYSASDAAFKKIIEKYNIRCAFIEKNSFYADYLKRASWNLLSEDWKWVVYALN